MAPRLLHFVFCIKNSPCVIYQFFLLLFWAAKYSVLQTPNCDSRKGELQRLQTLSLAFIKHYTTLQRHECSFSASNSTVTLKKALNLTNGISFHNKSLTSFYMAVYISFTTVVISTAEVSVLMYFFCPHSMKISCFLNTFPDTV